MYAWRVMTRNRKIRKPKHYGEGHQGQTPEPYAREEKRFVPGGRDGLNTKDRDVLSQASRA